MRKSDVSVRSKEDTQKILLYFLFGKPSRQSLQCFSFNVFLMIGVNCKPIGMGLIFLLLRIAIVMFLWFRRWKIRF